MLSQNIVLFSQYARLATLFVDCLQTLFFSSFDLLVELYDTEEAHQPDNSDNACHSAGPSCFCDIRCLAGCEKS